MDARIALAEGNFVATFAQLGARLPHAVSEAGPQALHLRSGMPIAAFNPSIAHGPVTDAAALFAEAAAFHARQASPGWLVAARVADRVRLEGAARAGRFEAGDEIPFMLLDDIPPAVLPSDLAVERVRDVDGLRHHLDLLARAFDMPVAALEPMHQPSLLDAGFAFFLGRVGGTPVTTSMYALSETDGVRCAGVYNVGTLPAFRGRGLGTAMTAFAAAACRDAHGATVAALQASPMGHRVYERMGYREVTRWQHWRPPA